MRALRNRLRRTTRSDGGMTLVELLVAMFIFSIVLAIVGTAMRSMIASTVRVNGTGEAVVDVDRVFNRLDKQVPYASAINAATQVGTRSYIEFRTDVEVGGFPPGCWQYRLDSATGLLQVRRAPEATPAAVTAWSTIATEVQPRPDAAADPPFSLVPSEDGGSFVDRQQLRVAIDVTRTGAPPVTLDTSWVARNTNRETATNKFIPAGPRARVCEGMPQT